MQPIGGDSSICQAKCQNVEPDPDLFIFCLKRSAPQRRSLLLKARSRSLSGAILERSAPRGSKGVGDEGGLIWGSRFVRGNQIVKNKDLTPNHGRMSRQGAKFAKVKRIPEKDFSGRYGFYTRFPFAPFAALRERRIYVLFVRRSQGFQFVLEIAIIPMIGNGCGGCRVLREFL